MYKVIKDFDDFIKVNLATIWQQFKNNIVKISVKSDIYVIF